MPPSTVHPDGRTVVTLPDAIRVPGIVTEVIEAILGDRRVGSSIGTADSRCPTASRRRARGLDAETVLARLTAHTFLRDACLNVAFGPAARASAGMLTLLPETSRPSR